MILDAASAHTHRNANGLNECTTVGIETCNCASATAYRLFRDLGGKMILGKGTQRRRRRTKAEMALAVPMKRFAPLTDKERQQKELYEEERAKERSERGRANAMKRWAKRDNPPAWANGTIELENDGN